MVVHKKAARKQWPSSSLCAGAELATFVKSTYETVAQARSDATQRFDLAAKWGDQYTEKVLAVMTDDVSAEFQRYETLHVLTSEAQQARNAMRSSLFSAAKEVITKTEQLLNCVAEPHAAALHAQQVIETAYAHAAERGDALKQQLRSSHAAVIAKLDEDFQVALDQVDTLKESLVAKMESDVLRLTAEMPPTREYDQTVLHAFNLASSFLQKLKKEEADEAEHMRVEDDKRLEELHLKEERYARINMDPSRPAYAEVLQEKQAITECRTTYEAKIVEHEDLSNTVAKVVSTVKERSEKACDPAPAAKKRRLFGWFGA